MTSRVLIRDNTTGAIRTTDGTQITLASPAPTVQPQPQLVWQTPVGDVDGVNAVFTIDPSTVGGTISTLNLLLFVNGVLQTEGTDFMFTDATTVTFVTPPLIGSTLTAVLLGTPTPPTTTPPPVAATNILSNGDFNAGSDGWSGDPPADWGQWSESPDSLDFGTPSEADIYLGQHTERNQIGYTDHKRSGLVYVGDEWTPDLFSNWLLTFDWKRIGELDTNNPPYGIGGALGFQFGPRTGGAPLGNESTWYPESNAGQYDWQRVGIQFQVEPNGFLASLAPVSAEWQFALTGARAWVSPSVPATAYGFAFAIRNVSLSLYTL